MQVLRAVRWLPAVQKPVGSGSLRAPMAGRQLEMVPHAKMMRMGSTLHTGPGLHPGKILTSYKGRNEGTLIMTEIAFFFPARRVVSE